MIDYFVSFVGQGNFTKYGNAQISFPHHIRSYDDIHELEKILEQRFGYWPIILFYKELIAE